MVLPLRLLPLRLPQRMSMIKVKIGHRNSPGPNPPNTLTINKSLKSHTTPTEDV